MKKIITTIIPILLFCCVLNLSAQGVSRSMGVGLRAGFWNHDVPKEAAPGVSVSALFSGSFYFFSRLDGNWFLETSLGGVAKSEVKASFTGTGVESATLTPLLFGARYDLLSPKYNSMLQPYISLGAGAYFSTQSNVGTSQIFSANVSTETKTEPGVFLGTGINAVISPSFALNADFKYHAIHQAEDAFIDFSGTEFSIGFSYMWGKTPQIYEVDDVKLIVQDIYPAYYQFYNTYPIALVALTNTSSYPIEVNVISEMPGYSERIQESGFIKIGRDETKDIPVQVLFGPKLLQTTQRKPAVLDLRIEARTGDITSKTVSVNLFVHSRNAWNGQIDRLGFFITPDDDDIMKYSREIVANVPASESDELVNVNSARAIFNTLQNSGLYYQSDPNIPFYKDDYVQFAKETIEKNSGDCDDLVVLYSSMLESIGINTAFIQVKDPSRELAHLLLMFDSGLPPEKGHLISSNEKRFVIQNSSSGKSSIWLPIETTLVTLGFDKAWEAGATTYLQDGVIRSGIQNGWFTIISVD
ncbi:MAG: outer membrane beta-barrel protein [Calditrichaeota bacterium]|nr:outer membrane beta-barrel protein [Calditrichota bacterium]